jgi:acetyltransferase-like isoleucine patch superfamily enzyme
VLLDDYFHLQQDCNLMSVDIGKFSSIASMVRIGNGAVVGSNSVVTKDVALYTIVGGVAAKTIRQRFPRDIAHALESTA